MLLWIIGFSALLLVRALRLARTFRLVRRASAPTDPALMSLWQELAASDPTAKRATLCVSAEVASPACFGWRRPVLLVPVDAIERISPDALRWALRHELVHVARGDSLVALAQAIATTLFWFHPAAWWLSAEVSRLRELSCDLAVVQRCGRRKSYAHALLEHAAVLHGHFSATDARPHSAGVRCALLHWGRSPSQIERRIEMLAVESGGASRARRSGGRWLAGALFALPLLAQVGAAATLVPGDETNGAPIAPVAPRAPLTAPAPTARVEFLDRAAVRPDEASQNRLIELSAALKQAAKAGDYQRLRELALAMADLSAAQANAACDADSASECDEECEAACAVECDVECDDTLDADCVEPRSLGFAFPGLEEFEGLVELPDMRAAFSDFSVDLRDEFVDLEIELSDLSAEMADLAIAFDSADFESFDGFEAFDAEVFAGIESEMAWARAEIARALDQADCEVNAGLADAECELAEALQEHDSEDCKVVLDDGQRVAIKRAIGKSFDRAKLDAKRALEQSRVKVAAAGAARAAHEDAVKAHRLALKRQAPQDFAKASGSPEAGGADGASSSSARRQTATARRALKVAAPQVDRAELLERQIREMQHEMERLQQELAEMRAHSDELPKADTRKSLKRSASSAAR